MMKTLLLAFSMAAICPATVFGQTTTTELPNSVDILVIPTTGDPAVVAPVPNGVRNTLLPGTVCNLAASPPPTLPLINPDFAEFEDPFNAGRVCRVAMPTGLATGDYRGVAVFIANSCTDQSGAPLTNCRSARSAVGLPPFSIAPIRLTPVPPRTLGFRP